VSRPARPDKASVEQVRNPGAPADASRRVRPRDGGRGLGAAGAMQKPEAMLPGPWAAAPRLQQVSHEAESVTEFIERHRLLWAEQGLPDHVMDGRTLDEMATILRFALRARMTQAYPDLEGRSRQRAA